MKWIGSGMLRELQSVAKENILVFDVETTGVDPDTDEILQLSMIDGSGKTLFSSYIKPVHTSEWIEAAKINGITKEMVANAPTFAEVKKVVQRLFQHAELVVGYNVSFDAEFLKVQKIYWKEGSHFFDLMKEFSDFRGVYDEKHHHNKWFKLVECAEYFGYRFNAHDALEDVKATLYSFDALICTPKYQSMVLTGIDNRTLDINSSQIKKKKIGMLPIGIILIVLGFILCGVTKGVIVDFFVLVLIGGIVLTIIGAKKNKKNKKNKK